MRFKVIVVALLLLMANSVFAQGSLGVPDAIFYNGKVVTVDADFHVQQAFAVQGEKFIAVGTNAGIKKLAGKGTRLVDLKGATVIPGLSDNHDHLFNACRFMWRGVDMIGVTSLAEMQSRLKKAVAAAKPGQVVFTTLGWTDQSQTDTQRSRSDLGRGPDRPDRLPPRCRRLQQRRAETGRHLEGESDFRRDAGAEGRLRRAHRRQSGLPRGHASAGQAAPADESGRGRGGDHQGVAGAPCLGHYQHQGTGRLARCRPGLLSRLAPGATDGARGHGNRVSRPGQHREEPRTHGNRRAVRGRVAADGFHR